MKTTEILNTEVPIRSIKHCIAVKRLVAVTISTLLMACAVSRADAQVYSQNAVGYVSDMTTHLLTAPMTTAQRQALHAKNFNQLPASDRALYLHAVAFDVGIMVGSDDGQPLSSAALANYLKTASLTEVDAAASPALLAHKALVKAAMQELNVIIAPQVSNNATFQQAMESGAVNSFWYNDLWW